MLDQLISAVVSFIVEVISAAGYFGVVLLMAIESACIPLPSEVIMPFAGYLVSLGQFSLIGAATMGALGCNVGSTIAYYVAATGGRKAFERWGGLRSAAASRDRSRGAVLCPLRLGHRLRRPATSGGTDLHRFSGGAGANADVEVSGLYVSRLVAVVFRPRLYRLCPGCALEQRPDFSPAVPRI